jgi:hypothetical protein
MIFDPIFNLLKTKYLLNPEMMVCNNHAATCQSLQPNEVGVNIGRRRSERN